jgi:hypothetical protein
MITLQQLKEATIQKETEWLREAHKDEAQIVYIEGMNDEINSCESVGGLVDFYIGCGYDMFEAYECVIDTLMNSEFNSARQ